MKKIWVFLLFAFVLVIWGLTLFLLSDAVWEGVPYIAPMVYSFIGDRGTFGDMFGAVNALFSGLAFAGLICTLLIQKDELSEQRKELALTTSVMEKQSIIMDAQLLEVERQGVRNTINTLTENLRMSVDNIVISGRKTTHSYAAFSYFIESILINIQLEGHGSNEVKGKLVSSDYRTLLDLNKKYADEGQCDLEELYKNLGEGFLKHVYDFTSYINTLRLLLQFILRSGDDDDYLSRLAASSLTSNELLFIFYLGLWDDGIKQLIEDTGLLVYFPTAKVGSIAYLFEYNEAAYGGGYPLKFSTIPKDTFEPIVFSRS
ncbi:MAG: hypothetical protein ACI843_001576 [Psychrobacter glaciei]